MKKQDLIFVDKTILQHVCDTELSIGDTIPSIRSLQSQLHLSRNAVLAAISSLRKKGIILKGSSAREGYTLCTSPSTSLIHYGGEHELTAHFLLPFYTWNYTINEYLASFESVFSSHDINLIFSNTHNSVEEEKRLLEGILAKPPASRPDFLLLTTCNSFSNPNLKLLQQLNAEIPVILIDRFFPASPYFHYIGVNNVYIGSRTAQYLLENNHSNIGYIKAYHRISTIWERFVGFQNILKNSGIVLDEKNIFQMSGEEIGFLADIQNEVDHIGAKILSLSKRPTAIVCSFDRIGVALMNFLLKNNVRVPEDICIIGCDEDKNVSEISPMPLTTFRHSYKECAEAVVEQMYKIQNRAPTSPCRIEFYSDFILGKSTAANYPQQ